MATRRGFRVRHVGKALPPFRDDFVDVEALSGIVLLGAAAAALVWANANPAGYVRFWHHPVDLSIGSLDLALSRGHWVTDGLMTLFFFVVGLEIKREVVRGDLRNPRAAALPIVAAVGGMIVPAALYAAVNVGGRGASGWAIPMATDIAFAVGLLALLGDRVPRSLKLFLLTLAIVDDIGAIIVIAVFYSGGVDAAWLAAAIGVVGVVLLFQRMRVSSTLAYVIPALALWLFVYRPFGGRSILEALEHRLHPWSSFVVVPLFALATAGIPIDGDAVRRAVQSPVTIGIVLGLIVGKTVGVTAGTLVGLRLGLGRLPAAVRLRDVAAVGALAGIGFTVALFVTELSFHGARFQNAVIGILAGSTLSGALGAALLSRRRPRPATR